MQEYFYELADAITSLLTRAESFTCTFSGENSDFIRFNHGLVRQGGSIEQRAVHLDLIEGKRHAAGTLSLTGDAASDRGRMADLMAKLRAARVGLPEDPLLLYAREVRSTETCHANDLPEVDHVLEAILRAGRDRDLVGIYAAGGMYRGFANGFGQRNWYDNYRFNLDWSFHHAADRAVKASYAGVRWEAGEFGRKVDAAAEQLAVQVRPARTIPPGQYRAYLAPAALYEIVGLLSWGGFGLRAHRTKTTPLLKMIEDGVTLHSSVSMLENTRGGIAPDFQEAGFIRPNQVTLIEKGVYHDCLVSPRAALEYGTKTNGASADEAPLSLKFRSGDVAIEDVLPTLDRGIYVNNLWYLNFSDRAACRITGLTRFATFWVEDGAIQAPLSVMRFDETLFRMLGENLIGLTSERSTLFDSGSYFERSIESARLPGALVDDFTLTI